MAQASTLLKHQSSSTAEYKVTVLNGSQPPHHFHGGLGPASERPHMQGNNQQPGPRDRRSRNNSLSDGGSWLAKLYLNPRNGAFWWFLTIFIITVLVMSWAFGFYYIWRKNSLNSAALQKQPTINLSWKKSVQIIMSSMSVGASFVVATSFIFSPMFRNFAFPGVAPLCFSHLFVDWLRLLQLTLDLSVTRGSYCPYVHFLFFFFQPASILWVGAIATSLYFSVRTSSSNIPEDGARIRNQWSHVLIWTYSMINAWAMSGPYFLGTETFVSSITSGVCVGRFGIVYSYLVLPLIILLFASGLIAAFQRKMRQLYPRRTSKRLNWRSNKYIISYIITWIIIITCQAVIHFADVDPIHHPNSNFLVIRLLGYIVYDSQGLIYGLITLCEFAYFSNRVDVGLHLQNIDISDVDFNCETNTTTAGDGGNSAVVTLGEGSFAVVFKAIWRGDTEVAVKVFKLNQVNRDAMKMEAYLASKLKHPNLLLTYGCSLVNDDNIAILTEYMGGGTVDDLIFGVKRPSYVEILRAARMIASGMDFLHSQTPPVVHRDLKPSNLLIDSSGVIKVADFGCSRWVIADSGRRRVSFDGEEEHDDSKLDISRTMTSNLGSPCWTAPELMNADSSTAQYSVKVDVYSFAMIMWQLYTGLMPYYDVNGSLLMLEEKVVAGHRPSIPHSCPFFLARLMTACWAADPSCRPAFGEILHLIDSELALFMQVDHSKQQVLQLVPNS